MKKLIILIWGLVLSDCFFCYANSDLPEPKYPDFKKDGLAYNYITKRMPVSRVQCVGLDYGENIIIPKMFKMVPDNVTSDSERTCITTEISGEYELLTWAYGIFGDEVEIKRLSVPRTISAEKGFRVTYNVSNQGINGLEDLYIPSLNWLYNSNYCFVSHKRSREDIYDGFTIWEGEYGSDDAYPVTEMTLPAFYDGKEYRFENIKGLKTIDLSNLRDTSRITIVGCKDLEEVILNPATEVLSIIEDCHELTNVALPECVVEVSEETLKVRESADLKFPTALKKIVGSPYCEGGLTEIVMPDNLEKVSENAFGNNLEHAVVGQRVRELSGVFSKCEYLKDVVIGSRVATIEAGEFKQSTVLQTVESLNPEPPQSTGDIFDAVTYLYATLYVPIGSKTKYEKATGWRKFAKIEEKEYPAPSPIDRLTKTSLRTYQGDAVVIEVELERNTLPILTYCVEDESVATVDADGTVHGLTTGQTVVSVIPDGKEELAAKCVVTVMEKPVAVERIEANPISIRIFDENPIEHTVYPENATIKDIEWTSSNRDVAYVTCDGYIIGIGKGEAVVYGKAKDGTDTIVEIPVSVDYALSVEQPNILSGSVNVKADGLNVNVNGLSDSEVVALFSIDGVKLAVATADAQGRAAVTAPSAGIYIVKAGSEVRKVYLQ